MSLKTFQGVILNCNNFSFTGQQILRELCWENIMQVPQFLVPRSVSRNVRHAASLSQPGTYSSEVLYTSQPSVPLPSGARADAKKQNDKDITDCPIALTSTVTDEFLGKTAGFFILQAIQGQKDPPHVMVGSLSSRRKVPFYQRVHRPLVPSAYSTQVQSVRTYCTDQQQLNQVFEDMQVKPSPLKEELSFAPRKWEYTYIGELHRAGKLKTPGMDFTLMSYNVLAQSLLEDNYYLYTGCDPEALDWGYRKQQVLKELRYHSPDVICLQEVQEDHYHSHFYPELKKEGLSSCEGDNNKAYRNDFCSSEYYMAGVQKNY